MAFRIKAFKKNVLAVKGKDGEEFLFSHDSEWQGLSCWICMKTGDKLITSAESNFLSIFGVLPNSEDGVLLSVVAGSPTLLASIIIEESKP